MPKRGFLTVGGKLSAAKDVYQPDKRIMSGFRLGTGVAVIKGFAVSVILLGEQALLTVAAIPLGFARWLWLCTLQTRSVTVRLEER